MHKVLFSEDKYYMFSNWSAHAIELWDNIFMTADHAYHFRKFINSDFKTAKQILKAKSPFLAKEIANANKSKIEKDWDGIKINVFYEINKAKALQHKDVYDALIATKDLEIIENSPYDNFWGVGPDGKGRNELGKLWMKIRKDLVIL